MYPVVFLSYDEPNADENFELLQQICPQAIRIHGVKGSDAAHKAAAAKVRSYLPDGTHMFTVDADNRLILKAWNLLMQAVGSRPEELHDHVLSWRSINSVNGLCYGNGGLKLWPLEWVDKMQTHEASEGPVKVDFCWDPKYTQLEAILSTTHINGSPAQAFRAGFREGAKMSLWGGQKQGLFDIASQAHRNDINIQRLIGWCSLGLDATYGDWCVLGALDGFWSANEKQQDLKVLLDHDALRILAEQAIEQHSLKTDNVDTTLRVNPAAIDFYRDGMQKYGLRIPKFGAFQSKTCKLVMEHRQPHNIFEREVWNNRVSALC